MPSGEPEPEPEPEGNAENEEAENEENEEEEEHGSARAGAWRGVRGGFSAMAAVTKHTVDATRHLADESVSLTMKGVEATRKGVESTVDRTTALVDDVVDHTKDFVDDSISLTSRVVDGTVDGARKVVKETTDLVEAYAEDGFDGIIEETKTWREDEDGEGGDAAAAAKEAVAGRSGRIGALLTRTGSKYDPEDLESKTDAQLRRMCENDDSIADEIIGEAYAAGRLALLDLLLSVKGQTPMNPHPEASPAASVEGDADESADTTAADSKPAVDPAVEKYLRLKFEGNESSVPRAGPNNLGAESTDEELQEYRGYLFMLEGMPMPESITLPTLVQYQVEQPAILRSGFALNSPKCNEALKTGQVIEVIEMATNPDNNVLRIRCSRGWASERASDGTALLVPKLTAEQERAVAIEKEIHLQKKLRAQLATNAAEAEFSTARDCVAKGRPMDAVAALQRAAKTDESRRTEAMEQILDVGNRAVRSGRLRDAIVVFQEGSRSDPSNVAMMEALDKATFSLKQEELGRARDDYILEILNEQADGTDPVTGRRALLSEMSCSLRVLAGMERAKLHEKIDSRDPGLLEDNSVYEQRGASGSGADDTQAGDTAEILLDVQYTDGALHHAVVIGPPYSGRSSLLRQLAYMAAVAARDDKEKPVPILIDLAELIPQCSAQPEEEEEEEEVPRSPIMIDAMALVRSKVPAMQFEMLEDAFERQGVVFLCDNMDRCGQFYVKIASYLVNTLSTSSRIIATSTFSRFKHQHLFARFGVVQLEPLTIDAQQKTARARLSASKRAGFDALLQIPAVCLFAQSPLTLCLVVELASGGKMESSRATSRNGLYEQCAQLMIERMARKCDDTTLRELGLTAAGGIDGKLWLFLERLAFLLHTHGSRDFEQEDVRELGAAEYQLWRGVVPILKLCTAPILCQLPDTEIILDGKQVEVENGAMHGTWRFTHVAFQEYFFARSLMKRLTETVDFGSKAVSTNDEFCSKRGICIKNEEFCIQNDELCRWRGRLLRVYCQTSCTMSGTVSRCL